MVGGGQGPGPELVEGGVRAPLQHGPVAVGPAHVRGSDLSTGARAFLDQPDSRLLEGLGPCVPCRVVRHAENDQGRDPSVFVTGNGNTLTTL